MKKVMIGFVVGMVIAGCTQMSPTSPSVVRNSESQTGPIGTYVPGTASLWLAGQSDGTRANPQVPGGYPVDVAPDQSPVYVTLEVGKVYTYLVGFGCVKNGPELPCSDANGSYLVPHSGGDENGILNLVAPLNSLIGLFRGSNQPFFLGMSGELVAKSDRLWLGTMDGFEWNNNSGQFAVKFYEKE